MKRENGLWLGMGLILGMGIGWLTAPGRGRRVRAQMRQKLDHWRREGEHEIAWRARDMGNRVRGGMAEARESFSGRERFVDEATLVDQVKSQLGRSHAEALERVNLNAVGHTLYLHGSLDSALERERFIHALHAIPGVEAVRAEYLRVGSAPPPATPMRAQRHWAPPRAANPPAPEKSPEAEEDFRAADMVSEGGSPAGGLEAEGNQQPETPPAGEIAEPGSDEANEAKRPRRRRQS